jgi:hypothetical protein
MGHVRVDRARRGASSYITADMTADAALAKLIADLGTS